MKDTELNKNITRAFEDETGDTEIMVRKIRNNIFKELRVEHVKTKSFGYRFALCATAAVAVLVICSAIFITTPSGIAFAQGVKERFFPVRNGEISLEGMIESQIQTPVASEPDAVTGKAGYVIYTDEETFETVHDGDISRIIPLNPVADAFMEITQYTDISYTDMYDKLYTSVEGEKREENANITAANKGFVNITGRNWNDKIIRYYCIDNERSGTFVIKVSFILEAEEGFGARYSAMLSSFEVLD